MNKLLKLTFISHTTLGLSNINAEDAVTTADKAALNNLDYLKKRYDYAVLFFEV